MSGLWIETTIIIAVIITAVILIQYANKTG